MVMLMLLPFENGFVLTLSGSKVRELFEEVAKLGGEGLSHGTILALPRW